MFEAENRLLRRLVRVGARDCVGVAGEPCGETTAKSPCPCVKVSVFRTSSDEVAMSPCPWMNVKARMGVASAVTCAEGMTTLIVRERDGGVRAEGVDGTASPDWGADAEPWVSVEIVDMFGLGVDGAEDVCEWV